MARLTWNGDAIVTKVTEAAIAGTDATMDACVASAKTEHEWDSDSGELEGSIGVRQSATVRGATVVGRWGSDLPHALYMEIGTSRIGERVVPREEAGGGNMWQIPGPFPAMGVTVQQAFTILPPGTMKDQAGWVTLDKPSKGTGPLIRQRPYLRPAADREYRLLATRIRVAFQGGRP